MSEAFSPEISDRICKHMNDDHADAVALYAKVFGDVPQATTAKMLKIDAQGMDLAAQVDGAAVPVRVLFDHELVNSEDAHHTLIAMVKQAYNLKIS
jgi:putative heme iron utilization protein